MSEYNLEFSEAMSESSRLILDANPLLQEAPRASLYMALVSCEISLKYILDKAGSDVPKTHNLSSLLKLVSECTIDDEITAGVTKQVSAGRIRSVQVCRNYNNATLGNLLESEAFGASKFPNKIRYGEILSHFPANVMQKASMKLISWVKRYEDSIKYQPLLRL